MPTENTINTLNRVLEILGSSFPQYLVWGRPYIPTGRESFMRTIETIVAGQNALAERVSRLVFESGGLPDHGNFPIEFTDTHDLDIDFLIAESIDLLRQDVSDLETCVDALRLAPAAQSLASEALGLTKGHVELLEKLPVNPIASTVIGPKPAAAGKH